MLGLAKLAPGAGHVGLAERPEFVAGPGQALLEVRAAGICGTDLHIWLGEYPSVPPVTMGHEVCGVVCEVGPGVDAAWVGARVTSETYFATCGRCAHCRDGRPNLCAQRRSIGTHADGAFAPLLAVPAAGLHRVPDELPDAAAALCEPVACVCQSLLDPPRVAPGDRVLVVGPGTIGLVAAQVARAGGGVVTVVGAPRDEARLALAGELGFGVEVAGTAEATEPFDVVVECSGSEGGVRSALQRLRRGGALVQMGLRGADVTVPWDLICLHELTVTAGFASTPRSWRRAMRLIEGGDVALAPLVSEVVALASWERAFEATRAAEGVKLVLAPGAQPGAARATSTSKATSSP
jgi:L-iditol 2-dehydrogenase